MKYKTLKKLQDMPHIVTNFPLKIPTPLFENLPLQAKKLIPLWIWSGH